MAALYPTGPAPGHTPRAGTRSLIVDEAHHALPSQWETLAPIELGPSPLFITTRPELVASRALALVEIVIAVGDDPGATISSACAILGQPDPSASVSLDHAHAGTAVVWKRSAPEREFIVTTIPPSGERRRHLRKYAEGELAPEKSFFFRGSDCKQNLRAQNLMTFIQLADGVDDETWEYHLKRNDYSAWMRHAIGDNDLSEAARRTEDDASLGTRATRNAIIAAVRERYTSPG
jgi:hypothetical protein